MQQFELKIANLTPDQKQTTPYIQVCSPYDQQPLGKVAISDAKLAQYALQQSTALFADKKRWLSASQRIDILYNTAQLMQAQFDDLVALALSEGGKPLKDTQVEVNRAIDGIKNCIECIRTQAGQEIPMGITPSSNQRLAVTQHEPIGPVLAISAFNHPLNLIVHQVAPAIAAGCPVIVKPAQNTPLSCFKFVDLLREAGLPDDYCQPILTDNHDSTQLLVSSPDIAFLSFIGSAKVGWQLRSQLAPGTRCALEHGGIAPLLVTEHACLEAASQAICKGGFYHAGQVCVSVQRVFVHEQKAQALCERIVNTCKQLQVGDPKLVSTDIGPLIAAKETQRVHQWVTQAIDAGAECLIGGSPINEACYPPTVLLNPPTHTDVVKREIFGPVICVHTFTQLEEAIAQANASEFAFQASIFTRSLDEAMMAYKQLNASAVMVNDHTAFRVDWMPFAGLKNSGYGIGGIPHTFKDMQIEKMLVLKSKHL